MISPSRNEFDVKDVDVKNEIIKYIVKHSSKSLFERQAKGIDE